MATKTNYIHMKSQFIKNIALLLLITFSPLLMRAQDPIRRGKKRTLRSIMVEKRTEYSKRKEDKKKWKEDREVTAVTAKNVKEHHKRLQSKNTRKAMRELRKKSRKTRK